MKKALITGSGGQDGSYLAELLRAKGDYQVFGFDRSPSGDDHVTSLSGDITSRADCERVFTEVVPDEVYHLAAQSSVGASFKDPEGTRQVNVIGSKNVFEAAFAANPAVRIFNAASSEMFGDARPPQSETTALAPLSPYAETKAEVFSKIVPELRKQGAFIASGILFNHESPRRGEQFVTRKVTKGMAALVRGELETLVMGDVSVRRDWGFAGEYVEAMWLLLQQDKPDDFIIATGVSHTLKDFISKVAECHSMSLVWRGEGLATEAFDEKGKIRVRVSEEWYRPADIKETRGVTEKIERKIGWRAAISFDELVRMLARADK